MKFIPGFPPDLLLGGKMAGIEERVKKVGPSARYIVMSTMPTALFRM